MAIQVADKADVFANRPLADFLFQTRTCWSFTRNDKQYIFNLSSDLVNHLDQEGNVFLVCDASDKKQHRPVLRDAEFFPKGNSISWHKALRFDAGSNHFHGCLDTVVLQHALHRPGRYHHAVQTVSLVAREALGQRTGEPLRQKRNVVVQIFLKERVVGFYARNIQQVGQLDAKVMRHKGRLYVNEVVLFVAKSFQLTHGPAVTHEPVFRVKRYTACRYTQDACFIRSGRAVVGRNEVDCMPKQM